MNIVGGENEDSYRKLPEFIQSETAELENISSNFIMKSVCCVWSNFIEKTYFHVPWYLYTWKYTDSVQFVYCLVCCMEMGVPIIARSGSDYISLKNENRLKQVWCDLAVWTVSDELVSFWRNVWTGCWFLGTLLPAQGSLCYWHILRKALYWKPS